VAAVRSEAWSHWRTVTLPFPEAGIRLLPQNSLGLFANTCRPTASDSKKPPGNLPQAHAALQYEPGDLRPLTNTQGRLSTELSRGMCGKRAEGDWAGTYFQPWNCVRVDRDSLVGASLLESTFGSAPVPPFNLSLHASVEIARETLAAIGRIRLTRRGSKPTGIERSSASARLDQEILSAV